jgi:ABC-type branched-subunit amino acid transport system substrate-binding protein
VETVADALRLIPSLGTPSFYKMPSVSIGLLFTLSGSLTSQAEHDMVDAALTAIDEINLDSGVLSKTVRPILLDSQSNITLHQINLQSLIDNPEVVAIFTGGESSFRKALLPLMKGTSKTLWYGSAYEGAECQDNVLVFGSVPNNDISTGIGYMASRGHSTYLLIVPDDDAATILDANVTSFLHDSSFSLSYAGMCTPHRD